MAIDEGKLKELLKSAVIEALEELENNTLIFVRLLNRKEIYKYFP